MYECAAPPKIRILVADDHALFREGVIAVLSRQPDLVVVAVAEDGRRAIELFGCIRPDIALIDLRMPVMDGFEVIRVLQADFPASRLLVLTNYDGDAHIRRALQAGACGYLSKSLSPGELVRAVREVNAGHRWIDPAAAARVAEHIGESDLTPRELEVLRLVVKGKSNKRISSLLGITEGTVKGHINSILSKMGVDDRTQAATEALSRGLIDFDFLPLFP